MTERVFPVCLVLFLRSILLQTSALAEGSAFIGSVWFYQGESTSWSLQLKLNALETIFLLTETLFCYVMVWACRAISIYYSVVMSLCCKMIRWHLQSKKNYNPQKTDLQSLCFLPGLERQKQINNLKHITVVFRENFK